MVLRQWLVAIAIAGCSSSPPAPQAVESTPTPAPIATPPAPAAPPDAAPIADPPPPPTLADDGASCLASSECRSGVCEGLGCDEAHPGTCAKSNRICARNRVPMCGCDGTSFFASSTCPRARYASRGKCPSP